VPVSPRIRTDESVLATTLTFSITSARARLWPTIADAFKQRHEFFKGRIRQVPEYAEAQRLNAEDSLKWLDEELANRPYIAGDRFTIADITAMIAIDFGKVSKIAIKPEQKNLARWHAEVAARPSTKA
jgi:glutathione S-transferase